jgi:aryl-alcohol dehydrogenase-like predicted oxidoreductase
MSKLALGTVQFGMSYGVSNKHGQTTREQIIKILELAQKNDIRVLDTASSYGNSENILGGVLDDFDCKIILKTPHFNDEVSIVKQFELLNKTFSRSLQRLGRDKAYGLLIHNCNDLFNSCGEKLFGEMERLRSSGLVKKIGVSVYTGEQIDRLLNNFDIDIIQLPVNIFDQRLIDSGRLEKLKRHGVEVHARSVFLQGLLLMPIKSIPSYFLPIKNALEGFSNKADELSISKLELALGYVSGIKEIDKVVVGVNTVKQFKQIIDASITKVTSREFNSFSVNNPHFVDPSCWKI